MKLERLHEYVLITVVTTIGVVLAAYAGKLTGAGDTKLLGLIAAATVFAIIGISLRERVWILIPLTWYTVGSFPFLPLPFSMHEIAVLVAFGWFMIFKAVKIIRKKPTYGLLDLVMFVNLLYLASVFVRNPVGVDALGSSRVGGRPYFITIVAFLAYWILVRAELTVKHARRFPLYVAIGFYFDSAIGAITCFLPSTAPIIGKLYSAIFADAYNAPDVSSAGDYNPSRLTFLGTSGEVTVRVLCSYFRPFTLLSPMYFWRFALLAISLLFVLLSGFRSALMGIAFMIVAGSYFRNRVADIVKLAVFFVPLFALLIAMQGVFFQLPIPAQRTLSFLPGRWNEEAKASARDSTEWRMMMWKAIITERKYIDSRWLGDGFGFTRQQWVGMTHANAEGGAQESFLITGQVHSGPLSAVKIVGFVGLGLFLILLLVSAREAILLIRRASGTPYFLAALFIGISIVYKVIEFNFIAGSFDGDLPQAIFSVGLLRLVGDGLAAYRASELEAARRPEEVHPLLGARPVLLHS